MNWEFWQQLWLWITQAVLKTQLLLPPLSLIEFICLSFAYCDILRQSEAASEITGKIHARSLLLLAALPRGWSCAGAASPISPTGEPKGSCASTSRAPGCGSAGDRVSPTGAAVRDSSATTESTALQLPARLPQRLRTKSSPGPRAGLGSCSASEQTAPS